MKKFLILISVLTVALVISACNTNPADVVPDDIIGGGENVPDYVHTPINGNEPDYVPENDYDPFDEYVEEDDGVPGIVAGFLRDGDGGSSVDIIIGSGFGSWPYAERAITEGVSGDRAFAPIPGATYRITYNVTSDGREGPNAWRVRWNRDPNVYPSYTDDADYVNAHEVSPEDVATVIPAFFNQGITAGGTYTLTLEITLDPYEEYNGLIGNITLRGALGNNEWFANWLTVEILEEGPGSDVAELLVRWER